jgi:probable F420-dependent oxidoreductase
MMTGARPLREMADLARRCADAGFSGLVVTEGGRTAYLSCAAAALATDGLELATGVAVAFPRSPMVTATVAWELAEASGGRFRLGLGPQVRAHVERRYAAPFDPPGPRMREYVAALRAIFGAFRQGGQLSFEGRYWRLSLLPPMWSPGPIPVADPPIDLAAVNPWMLRMAGEVADGVHVHPLNTPAYLETTLLPGLAEGLGRSGRQPGAFSLFVPLFTAVGDTEEERGRRREACRAMVAFYGSTPNYAFIFDQLGRPGTTERLRQAARTGGPQAMAGVIDDQLLSHFVLEGTWAQMPALVRRRLEPLGGFRLNAVLYLAGSAPEQPGALERFGQLAQDLAEAT